MPYWKAILLSFAICLAVLATASFTITLLMISHAGATGFAFSIRGLAELLGTSLVLGWLVGTIWYFARR